MAILGVEVSTVGQAGQVPKIIYIDTNDTVSHVTTPGFLNQLTEQNIPLSVTDIAIITTKESSSTPPVSGVYYLSYSMGDWRATAIGGGGNFDPHANYTTTGIWNNQGAWAFDSSVTLPEGSLLRVPSTTFVGAAIIINNMPAGISMTFTEASQEFFGSSSIVQDAVTGTGQLEWKGPVFFANSVFHLTGLSNASTSEVLFYDHATGLVTYGASGSSGDSWLLAGNSGTGGTGKLGTVDDVSFNIVTHNISRITFANSGDITFNNNTNNTVFNSHGVFVNSSNVALNGIPNATKINVVFIDPITKALSYGLAPSLSAWNLMGTNSGPGNLLGLSDNNDFSIVSDGHNKIVFSGVSQDIGIFGNPGNVLISGAQADISSVTTSTYTVGTNFDLTTTNGYIHITSGSLGDIEITSGSSMVLDCTGFSVQSHTGNIVIQGNGTAIFNSLHDMIIEATSGTLNLNGDVYKMNGLPAGVTADVIYFDPATKVLTYGASGAAGTSWSLSGNAGTGGTAKLGTTDAQPYELIVNNASIVTIASNRDISTNPHDFTMTAGANLSLSCVNSLTIDTQQSVFIGQNTAVHLFVGKNTNDLVVDCNAVSLNNIPSSTKPDIVYFDSATKQLSYGPVGAAAPGWLLTGNTGAGHVLGTTDNNGFSFIANNATAVVIAGDKSTTFTSGPLFSADASHIVLGPTTANAINIGSNTCTTLTITADNQTFTGGTTTTINGGTSYAKINGARVIIGDLGASTTVEIGHASLTTLTAAGDSIAFTGTTTTTITGPTCKINGGHLFVGDVTAIITIGGGGTTTSNFIAATNTITGSTNLNLNGSAIAIGDGTSSSVLIETSGPGVISIGNNLTGTVNVRASNAGTVNIDGDSIKLGPNHATTIDIGTNATTQTNINSAIVNFIGTSTAIIDGQATEVGPSTANTITIGRNPSTTSILSNTVKTPNISAALAADVLYFNPTNGSITYGPAPSLGTAWLLTGNTGVGHILGTTSNDSFNIVANNIPMIQVSSTALTYGVAGSTSQSMLGNNINFLSNTTFITDSATTQIKQAGNIVLQATVGALDLGNNSYDVNVYTNQNLYLRDVPPATKPNVLYIDQTNNGKVSYGPASGGGITKVVTRDITTVGSGMYVPTAGMVYVTVEVLGGGASGAGTSGDTGGSGGGSGGYAKRTYSAADIGASKPYTVGAGGGASATSSPGGNTVFASGPLQIIGGGAPAIGSFGTFAPGGNGGAGLGGDINFRGNDGGGTFKVGSLNAHGAGAASIFGGSTAGGSKAANENGPDANTYGAGGGGGVSIAAGSSLGGAGGQGIIILTEYIA